MTPPLDAVADGDRRIEYVVPLRWGPEADTSAIDAMRGYLATIAVVADITVADGSPPTALRMHDTRWGSLARIVPPAPRPGRNGKVAAVITGVRMSRHDLVVLADDDVRYRPEQLHEMGERLAGCDVVRPQNVFEVPGGKIPWHARRDTARTLLNRAGFGDYPGTFGVRRGAFLAAGGYDADVLFENLQMLRTMRAAGARIVRVDGLYVARIPPSTRQFWEQRIRQAYDDFGQPVRLAIEASWLPLAVVAAMTKPRWLPVAAATAVAVAEYGRRRAGGAAAFPGSSAWWAPVWIAERAVCILLAIGARCRGGVHYHGVRVHDATRPVR
jgi:hypothetical protein